ncbi:MAG: reverse transcriptase family protein [Sedimenticola sp.]
MEKITNLNILYSNVDVLTKNKKAELEAIVISNSPDIIALTEILPKSSDFPIIEEFYHLDGYVLHASIPNASRGVIIYTKNKLKAESVLFDTEFKEHTWCRIKLTNHDTLLIGCLYRSPNSNIENLHNISELLQNTKSCHDTHLLIMGDLNYKEINWKVGSTTVSENHPATLFLEITRDNFLFQHVLEPTRYREGYTPSLLDLIFTNEEAMVDELQYKPGLGKSDHICLEFKYNCYTEALASSQRKLNFHKGNYTAISEDLNNIQWEQQLSNTNLAVSWESFAEKLSNSIEKNIPVSRTYHDQSKNNPYVDSQSLNAIKEKHKKWMKYKYCKSEVNFTNYKEARNAATQSLRSSLYNYEKDLASKIKTDSKLFWKYVKSKSNTQTSIGDLETKTGNKTSNDQEIAECLNDCFSSVFVKDREGANPNFEVKQPDHELVDIDITEEKITKIINQLKPSKSAGPDNFHPRLFKGTLDSIKKPLELLYKKSISEGEVPEAWKIANVTPIYKSGSKKQPANYRPISLTSVPCKIMEKIVRNELVDHMERNNFFTKCQHGFRNGFSCVTQLLEVMEDWVEALDNGDDIDVIFLDFSRAFDKISHNLLLMKLERYGIKGNTLKWIGSFLSNRKQRVAIRGSYSKWAPVTSGVPQGSVLGPTLFLVYINDMPETIQSTMKLFADDSKIYRSISRDSTVNILQTDLDRVCEWSDRWQMVLNHKKCKHMHIGPHDTGQKFQLRNEKGTSELTTVTQEKDLGLLIDNKLKFSEHTTKSVSKANRNLGLIFRTFTYLDKDMFVQLFKSLVRPHLEYATPVWSPLLKKDRIAIENVQRRATKMVNGFRNYSYQERLLKLGLPSLEYRRDRSDLLQAYKIIYGIDKLDKHKMFTMATYNRTRGHTLKIYKQRPRLNVSMNAFSNRVVNAWNHLPNTVVESTSLNQFKSRLNKHWSAHPSKFSPNCY